MARVAVETLHSSDTTPTYWPHDLRMKLGLCSVNNPLFSPSLPAADIKFHPNWSLYETRRTFRAQLQGLEQEVPQGWPAALRGPLVWTGADFHDETEFVYHLTESDKTEIDSALERIKDAGLTFDEINPNTFPLPRLQDILKEAQEKLYNGYGFMILRGLDVDAYSSRDRLRVFLGVSSHLAARRGAQDQTGNLLHHLYDYSPLDSKVDLPLHTDITADIVATLTLQSSKIGGEAILASVWTVYNELAATRPDLVHVLSHMDWPFDTFGRDPPYYNRALLFHHLGKVMLNVSRRVLTGHPMSPRSQGIPGLTEAQAEALDAVHFIAKKHKLNVATEKGDMRFINNFALLHGREAFSDHDQNAQPISCERSELTSQRHLFRLWLHNPDMAWSLPPALKLVWARTFDEQRYRTWDGIDYDVSKDSQQRERLLGPKPGPKPGPEPAPRPVPYPCD